MSDHKFEFDADAIRELASILDETGLAEIELETSSGRIRIARRATTVVAPDPVELSVRKTPSEESGPPPSQTSPENLRGAIKSPMVGTAYLSPEPGSAPFVTVGAPVEAGDTLMIIEAMKVMNPIQATHDGVVRQILVENGHPVEYGQVVLVID